MASSKFMPILAVLVVLLPSCAFGGIFDGLPPGLTPFLDELCGKIKCGKGRCNTNSSFGFSYECECDVGWKRSPIDQVNDYLKFLPCIYPECTFNVSIISPVLPPLPLIPFPSSLTNFNSCYFIPCGAGTCSSSSFYEHTCRCYPGYKNLFNVSSFPCYSNNFLGPDCAPLGLEVSDTEADANGPNQATSFLPGKFHWMAIFIMSAVMAL